MPYLKSRFWFLLFIYVCMYIFVCHHPICIIIFLSNFWEELYFVSEKAMAPHSSTLAWKIPWTEEPGRLQSMGSLRVGQDSATHFHFSLSCIGERNGNPLQCSCLENPRDWGALWAAVHGVAQSRTGLKRLSSSSSSSTLFWLPIWNFHRYDILFTFN